MQDEQYYDGEFNDEDFKEMMEDIHYQKKNKKKRRKK